MPVEFSPTVVRPRFPAISWPAIFAAVAVGVAVQLLLSLAGYALGVYPRNESGSTQAITLVAASWAAVSMLLAAFVGGYVAARCSGLRRTGDGVLHGIVAWAATTLLYTALATTAVGALTTGLFGLVGENLDQGAAQAAVGTAGDRERALNAMTDVGLSEAQARAVLDQMARSGAADRDAAADAVGTATLWLAAAVMLALLLAILGGMIGVRGSRRTLRPERERITAPPQPRVLSRT